MLLVVGIVGGFALSNVLSNKIVLNKEGAPLTAEQKALTDASIDAFFAKHPEAAGKTNVEQIKADAKATAPKTVPSASNNLGAMALEEREVICVNNNFGGWNGYVWTTNHWELVLHAVGGTCDKLSGKVYVMYEGVLR